MKPATIQKLGGFALIAGAILFATYSVLFLSLFPADEIHRDFSRIVLSPPWIGVAALAFAGVVLMVFGFAAVYWWNHWFRWIKRNWWNGRQLGNWWQRWPRSHVWAVPYVQPR